MPKINIKYKISNRKQTRNSKRLDFKLFGFVVLILFGICFLEFGALAKTQAASNSCKSIGNIGRASTSRTCSATKCLIGSVYYCCDNQSDCDALKPTQGPIPSPAPILCNAPPSNPEFHSLRPYQASPCTVTPDNSAKFCGNDLTLRDTIAVHYPGSESYLTGSGCVTTDKKVNCTYTVPVTKTVTIDLSEATLPFMGNTEDVPNSQTPTSATPLTDAEKMNGYVSWYLNGVLNRAENGSSENTLANDVNFSGPINKLLPSEILDAQRIKTINNVSANTNHNQIAVCVDKKYWLFGPVTPKACYQGNGTPASGVVRLSDWDKNDLGIGRDLTKVLGRFLKMIPGISRTEIAKAVDSAWDKRTPPLPWADENGKPFASEILYQKAYNEWKGKSCVIFLNHLFCVDWDPTDILVNSEWSELYSYVPLSSTEDLKGSVSIDSVSSATSPSVSGVTITGVGFSGQTPSTLFFPHMQESSDLATVLQNTFVSSDETKGATANPTNVSAAPICNTVEVRSNKGDKLFATQLTGTLNYTADFSCKFDPITGSTDPVCMQHCLFQEIDPSVCSGQCQVTTPTQTCTKDAYITLSTTGNIPKADEIWSQLVAGPMAIFKRIFPKTNTEGSVGTIMDIPGSTSITYTGTDISQQNADLKFPHIGGISEYFLKGIQTALRPKGYGEPISFGNSESGSKCKQDVPDSAVPSKYLGAFKSNFINLANTWSEKCPGPQNNLAEGCYNYVVTESMAKGINPAFTLTIWLNESDASNYCDGGDNTQDFGINVPSLYQNLSGQLTRFLEQPAAYQYCKSVQGWIEPMHAFLSRFQSSQGACNPNDSVATQYYIDIRDNAWSWVSRCSANGKFGINWPTDNSCP